MGEFNALMGLHGLPLLEDVAAYRNTTAKRLPRRARIRARHRFFQENRGGQSFFVQGISRLRSTVAHFGLSRDQFVRLSGCRANRDAQILLSDRPPSQPPTVDSAASMRTYPIHCGSRMKA